MEKDALEKQKIQLEIKKLQTKWYSNIEFWKVVIPTLAVLATLYFTFGKGIIDAEKTKLEIQKEQLKLDISRFEDTRDELTVSITTKDSIKGHLEKQILHYQIQKNDLLQKLSGLKNKLRDAGIEIDSINFERADDRTFYQEMLLQEYKKDKANLEELEKCNSRVNAKDVAIASKDAEIKFLRPRVKLTETETLDLSIAKLQTADEVSDNQLKTIHSRLDSLRKTFETQRNKIDKMSVKELDRELEIYLLKYKLERN